MGKLSLASKAITSGDIYVFFQKSDSPTNPSYMVLDSSSGFWSSPFTLPGMTLHDVDFQGVYASGPKAVYYKNKIHLFGRAPDSSVQAMTYDGTSWSDSMTVAAGLTNNSPMPYAWQAGLFSDGLYLFLQGTDDVIYGRQLDENLNVLNRWGASNKTSTPLTICPDLLNGNDLDAIFTSSAALYNTRFNTYGFSSDFNALFVNSKYPSSVVSCLGGQYMVFSGATDAQLYISQIIPVGGNSPNITTAPGTAIAGANILTAPSAIVLDDDGTTANIGVFYADSDDTASLREAVIQISKGAQPTYTLMGIVQIDVPLCGADSSPFALVVA